MSLPTNFGFLATYDPRLAALPQRAELYFAEDPNTSLIKLRQYGELLASHVAALTNTDVPEAENFAGTVHALRRNGVNEQVIQGFNELRHAGNDAVHGFSGDHREALHKLKIAFGMATWFHRIQGHPDYRAAAFIPPEPGSAGPLVAAQIEQLKQELEKAQREAQNEAQLRAQAELQIQHVAETAATWQALAEDTDAELRHSRELLEAARLHPAQQVAQVKEQAATQSLPLDEADTRVLIDRQLREAGWTVDSLALTHAAGTRPQKGKSMAIAEWPTTKGPADYVLFLGLTPVAVVEAKRHNANVMSSLEQSKRYSEAFTETTPGGPWGKYQVPFLFSTNGRAYLRQLIEKSGIWFLDVRRPQNRPTALEGWFTPDGLQAMLAQDLDDAHARLDKEGFAYLNLRDYQIAAIRATEQAIEAGRTEILVAMATGTGKTRTAIALIYRLLKSKRFRRILFLVDRTALGTQSLEAFEHFRLEQNQKFTDVYDVKKLGDVTPDPTTRVQVATIQATIRRALDTDPQAPIDLYDCIIVDECHRGYNLDGELSELELEFRNEADYVSQYRRALDHFHAVRIGLTATPALHTTQIFGPPAFLYSYRQAVIDGYLVDHEPPLQIVTRLAQDGMTWEANSVMEYYDPKTKETSSELLPDEVRIDLEKFNRVVYTENFNKVVCQELARHLDPDLPGKTLVFCSTDQHADTVVRLLKETFPHTPDDAIVKITGKADKPLEHIKRYKNEQYPSIAVTVDLLTTGIDVPSISHLVFLRRVKSRILYQQMIGRATRLCPDIRKQCFHIYDAVELYKDMDEFSEMKPVVVNLKPKLRAAVVRTQGRTGCRWRRGARAAGDDAPVARESQSTRPIFRR